MAINYSILVYSAIFDSHRNITILDDQYFIYKRKIYFVMRLFN